MFLMNTTTKALLPGSRRIICLKKILDMHDSLLNSGFLCLFACHDKKKHLDMGSISRPKMIPEKGFRVFSPTGARPRQKLIQAIKHSPPPPPPPHRG